MQDFDRLNAALDEYEAFVKEFKITSFDLQAKLTKLVNSDRDEPSKEDQL